MKHVGFSGRLVIVGFGSIGQGALPLILRHIDLDPRKITIVTAEDGGRDVAAEYNIRFVKERLTPGNYRAVLDPMVGAGDFVVNLSIDVSSLALVRFCREKNAFYIDTCIEPWAGGYTDTSLTPAERTNYALREQALTLKGDGPTALVTHGANPGLVSHFAKRALLDIARDTGLAIAKPANRGEWASLMERLAIKVVHVAERDTQIADRPKMWGEFVNSWSIEGFIGEGCQPCELGWGTHEKSLPRDGQNHEVGSRCAIYLTRPGASVRVRSWTPKEGPYHGFLITHNESISLADYFSRSENGRVVYRPTVHYAYHPCDAAVLSLHELAGRNWQSQPKKRLLMGDIVAGTDELGVLLMGHAKGAYWFGSQLSIAEARALAPHNNATSLQVTVSVLAGMVWVLNHPRLGLVEPEEIDFDFILELCAPYLGKLAGAYSDWTPLLNRAVLFDEAVDRADPWQFTNFLVH
jgi:homospermidine synthase